MPSGSDPPVGLASTVATQRPAADADPARLAAGRVLAGRWRVVRFLAAGAMGEVYEAEDLELGERVALKRIRAEKGASAATIDRFKRETQLARRVSHPNVARIHELGVDRESDEPLLFLTMELLAGETLAARLARETRLTTGAARPIALQIAAGLDAAHAADVVHRDLKAANVMLVGDRVVIMDFGLARARSDAEDRLTAEGAILGTPAYMAPEQVDGRPVTPASDVYALGVMLFEMVTGGLPFKGANAMETAAKRLREEAPAARALVPSLDPAWDAAIARALRREPAERFATAGEMVRALGVGGGRRARKVMVAAALVALLGGGAALLWASGGDDRSVSPGAARGVAVRTVATMGFRNASGRAEAAWLSTAVSEMLATELAGDQVTAIPGEVVARCRAELDLPEADGYGVATLARIRRYVGSDYVVSGSYTAVGGQLRLDVRLQDARTGETIGHASEAGREEELFAIVGRIGRTLRGRLDIAAPAVAAGTTLPRSADAARLYASGLARLRAFDPQGAVPLLDAAVGAEPSFPLAHAALAAAWTDLDDEVRAEAAARRAFELSTGLPREEKLLVEARFRETAREWDRAIEAYRALIALRPADVERRLDLARVQERAGQPAAAAATVAALRQLPAAADDPRVDLAEANAAPDHDTTLRLQQSAARKAAHRGALLIQATALSDAAWSHMQIGDMEAARRAAEEARAVLERAGNRSGGVDVLNALAPVVAGLGDYRKGAALFDEAFAVAQTSGRKDRAISSLGNAIYSYLMLEDLAAARERLARLRPLVEESGAPGRRVYLLNLEGWLAHEEGDLAAAERKYREAAAVEPQPGGFVCLGMGLTAYDRDHLPFAHDKLRERLGAQKMAGDRSFGAETEMDLGVVQMERGELAAAEASFRAALAVHEHCDVVLAAQERALLAVALVRQGKPDAVAPLEASLADWDRLPLGQRAAIAAAALEVIGGAEARARVEALRVEVAKAGVVRLELELRLALAEDAARLGWTGAGRVAAKELAREAKQRGFARIARRAEALLAR